jgi:hypothetical protein
MRYKENSGTSSNTKAIKFEDDYQLNENAGRPNLAKVIRDQNSPQVFDRLQTLKTAGEITRNKNSAHVSGNTTAYLRHMVENINT